MIQTMKYGERLKTARKHAGLSQAELAEIVGVSQPGISQLEGSNTSGSEFTVQFAKACNVRAEWLALEDGPMISEYGDHRIAHVVKVMEALPELFRDEAMREVDSLAQLAGKVTAKKVSNGQ